jgi:arylsulfatase A-like enzyme
MQGESLLPLLAGERKSLQRKFLYYHFYEYKADHTVLPHLGIRGEDYKLIYFYTVKEWELYDLKKDPAEQNNLAEDPSYSKRVRKMKKILTRIKNKYLDPEPI